MRRRASVGREGAPASIRSLPCLRRVGVGWRVAVRPIGTPCCIRELNDVRTDRPSERPRRPRERAGVGAVRHQRQAEGVPAVHPLYSMYQLSALRRHLLRGGATAHERRHRDGRRRSGGRRTGVLLPALHPTLLPALHSAPLPTLHPTPLPALRAAVRRHPVSSGPVLRAVLPPRPVLRALSSGALLRALFAVRSVRAMRPVCSVRAMCPVRSVHALHALRGRPGGRRQREHGRLDGVASERRQRRVG
jgi:hypothetical protein